MDNEKFDASRLQEMSGGDTGFEQEILGMFFEDSQEMLDAIATKLAEHDFDTIRRTAHSLKGSSANLGALGVQKAAARLEDVAESGHAEGIKTAYEALQAVYDDTEQLMRDYLRQS